jgi:plasmid maintenance system killer protein
VVYYMKIDFSSAKLQKSLTVEKEMLRIHGAIRTKKLKLRLKVLQSAQSLQDVPYLPPDRCHPLKGARKGQFAVDLDHPFRLIFKPSEPVSYLPDNGIDLRKVTSVTIESVEDYHD